MNTLSMKTAHIAFPQHILSPYNSHPLHGWCPKISCHTPIWRLAGNCVDVDIEYLRVPKNDSIRLQSPCIKISRVWLLLNYLMSNRRNSLCFTEQLQRDNFEIGKQSNELFALTLPIRWLSRVET
jgi:hypothetical protein